MFVHPNNQKTIGEILLVMDNIPNLNKDVCNEIKKKYIQNIISEFYFRLNKFANGWCKFNPIIIFKQNQFEILDSKRNFIVLDKIFVTNTGFVHEYNGYVSTIFSNKFGLDIPEVYIKESRFLEVLSCENEGVKSVALRNNFCNISKSKAWIKENGFR